MVKVQKPNPKSVKKNAASSKVKNNEMKKTTGNSFKEKVKKMEKELENVKKNSVVENVKRKNCGLNKKSNATKERPKKMVSNEKPVLKIQENVSKNVKKKMPLVAVVQRDSKINGQEKPPYVAKLEKMNRESKGEIKEEQKHNLEVETNITPSAFEPVNFDEEIFKNILCFKNIENVINALQNIVQKEVSTKKTSIFSDYRYILNVSSYKIPNCPKRMVKLNLKHSLVDITKDDVVVIVPDLKRGAKVDYEPTIQHYESLLRNIGENNIKIMPFNQLRKECTSYEAKRKFSNTYDYFLCDGRIVGHVTGFCGSYFQKSRTTIHAVRLNNPKTYKSDLEHALKRTSYRQISKGDLISIPVGNHLFAVNQLVENIEEVIRQLKTIYPGGYPNIRNIHLKIDIKGTTSLPLYVNLGGAPTEVPNVIGPREERMVKLKKQANNILTKFSMNKSGEFVKLDKAQVKRKQQIKKARTLILSKESNEEKKSEYSRPSRKTAKKRKLL